MFTNKQRWRRVRSLHSAANARRSLESASAAIAEAQSSNKLCVKPPSLSRHHSWDPLRNRDEVGVRQSCPPRSLSTGQLNSLLGLRASPPPRSILRTSPRYAHSAICAIVLWLSLLDTVLQSVHLTLYVFVDSDDVPVVAQASKECVKSLH
jgi:hypothetical protein